jgi:glycosyltransferase A (GT-A) superfamily protein (DUF2064 family)
MPRTSAPNAGPAPRLRRLTPAATACAAQRTRIRTVLVADRTAMARALTGDFPVLLLRDGAVDIHPARSAELLASFDAVLGATLDGGWWAFGVNRPAVAAALPAMVLEWRDAGALTLAALRLDLRVAMLPTLHDRVAA